MFGRKRHAAKRQNLLLLLFLDPSPNENSFPLLVFLPHHPEWVANFHKTESLFPFEFMQSKRDSWDELLLLQVGTPGEKYVHEILVTKFLVFTASLKVMVYLRIPFPRGHSAEQLFKLFCVPFKVYFSKIFLSSLIDRFHRGQHTLQPEAHQTPPGWSWGTPWGVLWIFDEIFIFTAHIYCRDILPWGLSFQSSFIVNKVCREINDIGHGGEEHHLPSHNSLHV